MRIIIAGSRTVIDYKIVEEAVKESGFEITKIISGGARGVDRLGEEYAKNNKIPLEIVTADWDKHGKAAGYIRNEEMAKIGDCLIAIWQKDKVTGEGSKGTRNMISIAKRYNLKVFVKEVL